MDTNYTIEDFDLRKLIYAAAPIYEWHNRDYTRLQQGALRRYIELIPVIRKAAYECGYAIGEHGSMTRDCDLMAMPWTDTCTQADALVEHICDAVDGIVPCANAHDNPLPVYGAHGRTSWVIHLKDKPIDGQILYIDLSIMPLDV
jgi:hypothetical protein